MEPLTRKRIVWAGNHVQFEHWCAEEGIDPRDPKVYCITTAEEAERRLRGLVLEPGDAILYEGTWEQTLVRDFEPIWRVISDLQAGWGVSEE